MWVALAPLARAGEHVTLRNGFEWDCARVEARGEKVRLYFASGAGLEQNYTDVAADAVVKVESVPNVPAALQVAPRFVPPPASPVDVQPTATELKEMLSRSGAQHHVDADLLASVVHAESGGQMRAVSRTGARGLMQLMPGTASQVGVTNPFIADQNVEGGTKYLDTLLTKYHDNITLALAAYNAGPGAVDRYCGVPPFRETRAYVARVVREFNRRKATLAAPNQ